MFNSVPNECQNNTEDKFCSTVGEADGCGERELSLNL